jgi:glycosyltransferase involved in cell wall biosynthesis
MPYKTIVVTPWHKEEQLRLFLNAWGYPSVEAAPDWLYLQQDKDRRGCANTKNAGISRAIDNGAEYVVVLDDDCYPHDGGPHTTLEALVSAHLDCLKPTKVEMFEVVTNPPSRGTPYYNRSIEMPVAASMGFWVGVGDFDAPGQLVHGQEHWMEFKQKPIFGKYFPLCGMNLAFPASAWPWCQFIDVPRFDDIWQGFLWQKHAYSVGKCFSLGGPLVRHARQSNVWKNLREEAVNLEINEHMWSNIFSSPLSSYEDMRSRFGI